MVEVSPCNAVLAMLQTVIPDLIVLDENIHDPAAYEVCRQIKSSDKYHFIPVIFIGPLLSPKDKPRLVESCADDYFSEPFDRVVTLDCLKSIIERKLRCKYLVEKYNELKNEVSKDRSVLPGCSDPENETHFSATFEQFAVGITQIDVRGRFQKVNDRFCEIVGYAREELLSMKFLDLTYRDKKGIEDELMARVLAGEINAYEIEKRYIHKKGHLVWVKVYASVVRDESGSIKHSIIIVADISRQKKAESLLHESEAFFRTIYESSAIGIVRLSVYDKRIEQANAAFCRMLGYTENELIGKTLREISYGEDLPENIMQQKRLAAGEIGSIQMEKRYLHKDGHHVWGLLHANIIFDEENNPLYFIGNILDITTSKKSKSILEESEKKYRTYVDNSPHPIFVVDVSGRFMDVNPAACALTGYSREELTSMFIPDLCAPESFEAARDHFGKVKSQGKTSGELLFVKKDGTRFYMQVEAVKIDENTFLGLCADTTERKNTEKLLIGARMLAEDASNSKSEFIANISHELRTPLNIVIGYSDVLLAEMAGELNEKQRKFSSNIKEAGSNLLEIVNSLIYIAEIKGGSSKIEISEFDLPALISDMEKITRAVAARKSISLEFQIEDGIGIINADKSKFKMILHNLIENSIKFTSDNGSVKVIIERNDGDICVHVIDTGIGIPDDKQEKLFDPFVQLDWSHARRYDGVGIGLALVKGLIDMHGGSIALKSKVGEGTSVTFTIPQN
ncbi:MAG: PAS domain S-box protein [Methanolobus sp.]|nr:PAS domain S-box protein [Methanolobus sp.]